MDFYYGKAPLALFLVSVLSGVVLLLGGSSAPSRRPDLVLATFTKEHAAAYAPAVAEFEKQYNVKIQVQVVDQKALQGRLESALQVGADVPDMVELLNGTMGTFTRGPLDDVGFIDLTDRIKSSGLYDNLVTNRLAGWSDRGHIFALPHDVHPVMLVYRKDLVQQAGIDPATLLTWDDFCRAGRDLAQRNTTADGLADRYMIDLPSDGGDILRLLMLQHGATLFDQAGNVVFDNPKTADVVCWYVRQVEGKDRIAFSCGWGQTLSRAMIDGLCLFYICPDWRTRQIEVDVPSLSGKLALMPLPAWEPGGLNTSTWGGTGLAFTKSCRNPDLAWKLAMYLYYDPAQLGTRFGDTNILPPLRSAWNEPEFDRPSEFYYPQKLGRIYAALAPKVPRDFSTAYSDLAEGKLSEAFTNASLYYASNGETGFKQYTTSELKRCADRVRVIMNRNVFLSSGAPVQ